MDTEQRNNLNTMLTNIYKYILPYIQQIFAQKDSGNVVSELAANLCLCLSHCPNLNRSFDDLFKEFVENNCTNMQ